MKKNLVLFVFIITASYSFSVKFNNCSRYRTGNFYYHSHSIYNTGSYLSNRNDSIETEFDMTTKIATRFYIKWIDSCTYETRLLDDMPNVPDSISKRLKETLVCTTTILEGTKEYYLFVGTTNLWPDITKDTIWVR
ncbi:hypothetical protein [Parasediminibacterium sp. JCM 36343]|uniref:hypothetical protein n=1 Tax=Parasediminibacterium sp. JCM 36343 TaxID=3374279 RepID=UPI00397BB915